MATVKKHISSKGKITYYLRAYNGYDINGKQIEHTMTWSPSENMSEKAIEKELERQKVLFDEKMKRGSIFDSSTKFEEYSLQWLKNNKPPQLAPKTYERYRSLLNNINKAIGNIKLTKLQSHHLMSFYNNLREEGVNNRGNFAISKDYLQEVIKEKEFSKQYLAKICGISMTTMNVALKKGKHISIETANKIAKALNINVNSVFELNYSDVGFSEKTILHHHRLISVILKQATHDRLVPFNIADKNYMKAPRVKRKEAIFLDDKQLKQIIDCLNNVHIKWQTAFYVLLYSGMRRGELMGLEWKDIDFENKVITIRRTSQYVSKMGIITKDTKNASSERTIKLPDDAFIVLKKYRKYWLHLKFNMGSLWNNKIEITTFEGKKEVIKNDRLFIQEDSTPMNPDSFTDWIANFVKQNNLPKFSPHSLRHTNASLLIAGGLNIPTVSKRLGHANVSTTTKIYTHAIQSADEKASDILSDKINPIKNFY